MSVVSAVIVFLLIIGLAIWTGFNIFTGFTTGAIGTGTLTIIIAFSTWLAFLGVRTNPD